MDTSGGGTTYPIYNICGIKAIYLCFAIRLYGDSNMGSAKEELEDANRKLEIIINILSDMDVMLSQILNIMNKIERGEIKNGQWKR